MTTLATLACALSLGGWGTGGCESVGSPREDWRTLAADPGRSYLYRDGVQVAGYDHARDIYRVYHADTGAWDEPSPPPWAEEGMALVREKRLPNYGVDTEKLRVDESYRINGEEVTRAKARQALGRLPDDAGKWRLTLLGAAAETNRVAHDLKSSPLLAEWKERLLVQCYPPQHWSVARAGFVTGGKPTIYLQAPTGQVLHRQDDYADGPAGLAQALRRADPNYDARKDPDLRKFRPRLDLSMIPLPVWVLAGGGLLLWLRSRS